MTNPAARLNAALAGRYTLERELGRGGMATVWLAQDLKHDRPVALKVLRPELAAALGPERFLREVRITARLNHPHILPLLDSGDADGFLYYVMPYVAGESLRDRLEREKQLPLDDALQIAREVADALSYAHRRDVVHRDVKPENILLESGHAVVADFGIARAISAAGGEALTQTGIAVGTPAYMSPEQGAGSRELDGRSDLYSLGCVLYEMLAGRPPFVGPTVESIVHQHLTAELPNIASLRPAVPAGVVAALSRALAKTPADRFHPVALFGEAILPRASVTNALRPSVAVAGGIPWRRWRLIGAGVAVVVVGSVTLTRWIRRDATEPRHPRTAIAVLPFQNLSAEQSHAYFAGGLHDELLTQLSKVAALTVISRTSVMGYAGADTPPLRQIARELGVGSVVEGSVQVVGGRLQVNVQLIDAATDAHLWAERYNRTLDDAFAIQSDIAQRVVAAVGTALGGTEQASIAAAPTANPEAYQLYLQGLEYYRRPGSERRDLDIAQQLYERALALDPEFALARAALSEVHGWMYWWRFDFSPTRAMRQREEAEAALRLAPDLAQAHMAMGLAHHLGRRDYRRALEEFGIALQGLPNDARLLQYIGAAHRRLGNWDEAVTAQQKAVRLDPRDANLLGDLATTFRLLHRYADAVHAYNRALGLAPDLWINAVAKGWAYNEWQGQLDTLRAVLQGSGGVVSGSGPVWSYFWVTLLYWERQADSLLKMLGAVGVPAFEGSSGLAPTVLFTAWAHRLRGDRAAARAAFEAARVFVDSVLRERPDDFAVHQARGLALAGLGRRADAIREAEWLAQSPIYREDPYQGALVAEQRALILAQAGATEAALDEIERLLAGPSWLTVQTLRRDPGWDSIRNDPRFQALLVKYAHPKPVR